MSAKPNSRYNKPQDVINFGKTGLTVLVQKNDIERAIRNLKKLVTQEGVLRDIKRHEFYEKPSVRRRRRRAEAVSRWRKKERMLLDRF